ncbi:hypothetical protein FGG08_003718 [Glutinoglossum americanum]|uniref:alpha-1,2-Mannosidase n=1 Tax=Glutinoglossum americanum TaxID=1670608 RepID=A0A9P8I236_9PEZI|nr:hypothetical protein FGG08_003718 [Glutinoglossum americanum]
MPPVKRFTVLLVFTALALFTLYRLKPPSSYKFAPHRPPLDDGRFHWETRSQLHPVSSMIPLPTGKKVEIPRIQFKFPPEDTEARKLREERQKAVKETFVHTWKGYKEHAWLRDELTPISGGNRSTFGGWAATLVDSLDTLWLMDLREDFAAAVAAVREIDFTNAESEKINVFETTIRYLGGFLAAYDVSGGRYPVLLEKAREVGEMLYAAFDTPNRMPVARWDWMGAALGNEQEALEKTLLAEIGSLSLEFTRLSQLTRDPKFFDAVQRITDQLAAQQMDTKLPGMWPIIVNARTGNFTDGGFFTVGAMADSAYEYFTKEYLLLNGRSPQYRDLYERFLPAANQSLLFRPLTPSNLPILFPGGLAISTPTDHTLSPHCEHLACFAGGMVALGSKVFDRPQDMEIAKGLVQGCVWAYESMPSGIMPESFEAVRCEATEDGAECRWNEGRWLGAVAKKVVEDEEERGVESTIGSVEEKARKRIEDYKLVPGMYDIGDRRYILRPETIESLFILYRLTGDPALPHTAWRMFQAIQKHTRTEFGHAALSDVTVPDPPKDDSMESFWTAETLKYFWLMFSESRVVGLDEWVFNTEAHPFRREG